MIKGTIKDYTITTLEELIEHKIPRDNKEHEVCIHIHLNLHITGFKWDTQTNHYKPFQNKKVYKPNQQKLYIRYNNGFDKVIYKPIRSQLTKQILWEIVQYLYT